MYMIQHKMTNMSFKYIKITTDVVNNINIMCKSYSQCITCMWFKSCISIKYEKRGGGVGESKSSFQLQLFKRITYIIFDVLWSFGRHSSLLQDWGLVWPSNSWWHFKRNFTVKWTSPPSAFTLGETWIIHVDVYSKSNY